MSTIKQSFASFGKKVSAEAPIIATTTAVLGAVAGVALASRSGMKAEKLLAREADIRRKTKNPEMTTADKVRLVWKVYIPPAICLAVSVGSILTLHRVGVNRTASAMALYTVSERAFREYRDKTVERIGDEAEQAIRDSVAQDRVDKNPPSSEIVIIGDDVLCYDEFSGRYFTSSMEKIRKCVNDLNMQVINSCYASLTDFYDLLGLEPTGISDGVGWNSDELLEVTFSTTMSTDGRPCLAVDFRAVPISGYDRLV